MQTIGDFFYDYFGWIALAFSVVLLSAVAIAIHQDAVREEHELSSFMHDCTIDHKQYECTAMWRAGITRNHVVPMPIIIPAGR